MKLIKEKKLNPILMTALMYISFCASFWYSSRGGLAFLSYSFPQLAHMTFLFNDIVAFITAGIVPTIIYEVLTLFVFKFSQVRIGGSADDMRYALRFFYIPANIICFLLKLFYFFTPLVSVYGNILIDFVVTTAFFVWFLFYVAKNYVPKEKWGAMLYQIGGAYLIVYLFMNVASVLMGVFL